MDMKHSAELLEQKISEHALAVETLDTLLLQYTASPDYPRIEEATANGDCEESRLLRECLRDLDSLRVILKVASAKIASAQEKMPRVVGLPTFGEVIRLTNQLEASDIVIERESVSTFVYRHSQWWCNEHLTLKNITDFVPIILKEIQSMIAAVEKGDFDTARSIRNATLTGRPRNRGGYLAIC
jgi:hypothetical protein